MQRRGLFPPFLRAKLFPTLALQTKSRAPLLPAIIAAWPSNPTNQPSWEGIKHSHLYFSPERDFLLVSNALRRCCCRRGNCTGKLCCLDLRFGGESGGSKSTWPRNNSNEHPSGTIGICVISPLLELIMVVSLYARLAIPCHASRRSGGGSLRYFIHTQRRLWTIKRSALYDGNPLFENFKTLIRFTSRNMCSQELVKTGNESDAGVSCLQSSR